MIGRELEQCIKRIVAPALWLFANLEMSGYINQFETTALFDLFSQRRVLVDTAVREG